MSLFPTNADRHKVTLDNFSNIHRQRALNLRELNSVRTTRGEAVTEVFDTQHNDFEERAFAQEFASPFVDDQ